MKRIKELRVLFDAEFSWGARRGGLPAVAHPRPTLSPASMN